MAANAVGRPSNYTEAIGKEICNRLAGGESLLKICESPHIPAAPTVMQWVIKHDKFREDYACARQSWAVFEFDRMTQIMDTPCYLERTTTRQVGDKTITETTTYDAVEHRRLQIDTRKWALARMFPKVYGEAMQLRHADANGDQLTFRVEDARQRVAPAKVIELPAAEPGEE